MSTEIRNLSELLPENNGFEPPVLSTTTTTSVTTTEKTQLTNMDSSVYAKHFTGVTVWIFIIVVIIILVIIFAIAWGGFNKDSNQITPGVSYWDSLKKWSWAESGTAWAVALTIGLLVWAIACSMIMELTSDYAVKISTGVLFGVVLLMLIVWVASFFRLDGNNYTRQGLFTAMVIGWITFVVLFGMFFLTMGVKQELGVIILLMLINFIIIGLAAATTTNIYQNNPVRQDDLAGLGLVDREE